MFLPANGARPNARRVAVVVSLNNPSNALFTEFAADQVRRTGIDLIMIVVGNFNDPFNFNVVPSFTYDGLKNLYQATTYSALTSISPTLHDVLCQGMCYFLSLISSLMENLEVFCAVF
jgi:hypothetical protein